MEALTPNHLLLGRASPATPFIPDAQQHTDLRRVFRVSQAYADMIWGKWNRRFLPQWNERSKWNKEEIRQLEVNDLVWIVDEMVKRAHYKMGKVLEVYHGSVGRGDQLLLKLKMENSKDQQYNWHPCSMKVFFGRKTGPAMLAPVSCKERK